MSNCILTIGSATQAMKAVRTLNSYSIPSNTVKLSTSNSKTGCLYGIEIRCGHLNNVKRILSQEKIRFEEYKNGLS